MLHAVPATQPEKIAAIRQGTALPFTFENAKMRTIVLDTGLAAYVVLTKMDSEEESTMAFESVLYLLDAMCICLISATVDIPGLVEIHIVHIFLKTS